MWGHTRTHAGIPPPNGHRADSGNDPITHGRSFEITTKKTPQFRLRNISCVWQCRPQLCGSSTLRWLFWSSPPGKLQNRLVESTKHHAGLWTGTELNLWLELRTDIFKTVSLVVFSFLDPQRMTITQSGLRNSLCDEWDRVNQTRKKNNQKSTISAGNKETLAIGKPFNKKT